MAVKGFQSIKAASRLPANLVNVPKFNTGIVTQYPANAALSGTSKSTFLYPGKIIDRYGSTWGKWFSQPGTSYGARSISPGKTPYMKFEVLKPFEVIESLASPGQFNIQTGFGIQFQSQISAEILLKRRIISIVK